MPRSILKWAARAMAALFIGAPVHAAVVIPTPAGVAPGQQFIILLETSGTTTATSTDINTYNGFVQSAVVAAGLTYNGSAGTWSALGATHGANNMTALTTSSVPVFNVNGGAIVSAASKLVNNHTYSSAPDVTELGTVGGPFTWTGIFANSGGATATTTALGDSNVTAGDPTGMDSNTAFSSQLGSNGLGEHLYGFATFTAVPEPSACLLMALAGFATLGGSRARRHRRVTW
jgi:hypothetical protein